MKRLGGLDAAFLTSETKEWPAHVGCITVFDPSEIDGGFDVDVLKRSFATRLHLLPPLRWRVMQPALGLGRAHWIEDPDFDLDWHIRRISVPAPGGREELAATATDIYRHRLDRRRPLWELWVLEGLADGNVGMFWKIHHACIDGMAGAGMQEIMFDSDPGWSPPDEVEDDGWQGESIPTGTEVLVRSIPGMVDAQVRTARSMLDMGRKLPSIVSASTKAAPSDDIPRTRFNDPVGQRRSWAYTTVSLSDMKAVKNAHGVKVNDVYVAMVSGALRDYLLARDELPEASLVASIPVNARTDDSPSSGNMISGMAAGMATDLEDPLERLMAIHANTTASKGLQQAMGAEMLMNLADTPPPAMMALAARAYARTQLVKRLPPMFNVVVSNVPGPREPLYNQGAPIKEFQSMGIVYDGAGLFVGAMSYMDQMDVGVLGGAEALDDPFELADGIKAELARLVATIPGAEVETASTSKSVTRKTGAVKKTAPKKTAAKKKASRR